MGNISKLTSLLSLGKDYLKVQIANILKAKVRRRRRMMLIVVSEPCGCGPFDQDHENPKCKIYQERKSFAENIDKILKEFEQALKGE